MSMCPRVRGPVLRVVHMGRKKPLFAVLLEDVRSENMFWGEIHPVCVGGELLRAGQAYENDTRCQPDTANDCDMADFSAVTRSKMSHGWRPWNPSPPSPKKNMDSPKSAEIDLQEARIPIWPYIRAKLRTARSADPPASWDPPSRPPPARCSTAKHGTPLWVLGY